VCDRRGRAADTLQVIIKWRGKPVFIRHRTAGEIDEANSINVASLRDPETDDQRVKKPEWLVMLGMSIDGDDKT
jgi:ubiquinol-cytochrome c reductase iron-sulfur subunit